MYRYRIHYQKLDAIKYTSNLDLYKVWERSCRRAGLPLVYSQGFHPQPKINLACPLPLGITSTVEIVDIWLSDQLDLETIIGKLENAVPPGIKVQNVELAVTTEPAIQTTILSARYHAIFPANFDSDRLAMNINSVMEQVEIIRLRRTKQYDLRPLIQNLSLIQTPEGMEGIEMLLSASEGKTGRPDEVLLQLGIDPSLADITRVELIRNQTGG